MFGYLKSQISLQISKRYIQKKKKNLSFDESKKHYCFGNLFILGIETSCDDTGAAIVSSKGYILAERTANQNKIHQKWGGIVPKFAKEAHKATIDSLVDKVIQDSGLTEADLSAISVTEGPGLSLCLREGLSKACLISHQYHIPVLPVHHMEAHALVARLEKKISYPFMCLLVSGGHNILILSKGMGDYTILGTTLDDSIGEAFDKVATLLKLRPEPSGGASIERLASNGNPDRYRFSLPLTNCGTADFSFSGFKSAARIFIKRNESFQKDSERILNWKSDIAASFQYAILDHLIQKVRIGIVTGLKESPNCRDIIVAGGVATNKKLRQMLFELAVEFGLKLSYPHTTRCSDNGVMIAWAGIERLRHGLAYSSKSLNLSKFVKPKSRWPLGNIYLRSYRSTKSMRKRDISIDLTALTESEMKRFTNNLQ